MNPRWIEEMGWMMGQVYAAVTDRILINLARHFPYVKEGKHISSWDYQIQKLAEMGQVTLETEQIILESLEGEDKVLREILEEAIKRSLKKVDKPLREAAKRGLLLGRGFLPPELAPNQMQSFQAFYRQAADKYNLVNTTMLNTAIDLYQRTISDIVTRMNKIKGIQKIQGVLNNATGMVITGVETLNNAVRDAVKKMVEIGITGFIDRGGHHWSPEAYVTMDIRTTASNAAREAVFEQNERFGNDLFYVSWHNGARPLCFPWQGKVIARRGQHSTSTDGNGNTVEVYALSETTYGQPAGLFGINCGHFAIPFVPGMSIPRQPEQTKEENDKEYQESQQQRALERKYRYAKRDLAVLKAQGASKEEIAAQKKRVTKARENLDAFCQKTGRARRTNRERTPIKATFPDE